MKYQYLYIAIYLFGSVAGLGVGYDFFPWAKKGSMPSAKSDIRMKKVFKYGGYSMLVLLLISVGESVGLW